MPDLRIPVPAELAFGGSIEAPLLAPPYDDLLEVGKLPGSPFPVMVDLLRLGRHHAAILGTTGTGKSHLAFALVDGLAQAGSKVIVVDQTGQYASRFPDAPVRESVHGFLTASEETVCIYDLGGKEPIAAVNALARSIHDWCVSEGSIGADAAARCVLVLEEAHNFVPETFVINDWELKAKAQNTSMVLMESRKFGLGFMLVSQRTSMITKTSLSQCNTVFAFQAVDRTGLEYFESLSGSAIAGSIPTLPHRWAVVMGSAVVSSVPAIAMTAEADTVVA